MKLFIERLPFPSHHLFEDCEPEHCFLKTPCSPIPQPINLNFAHHVHSEAFRLAQIVGVYLGVSLKLGNLLPNEL